MSTVNAVSGTLNALGVGSTFISYPPKFNLSIWGSFIGTAEIERSFDLGVTWVPLFRETGTQHTYTGPVSLVLEDPEASVQYRIKCSAYTSGAINYRISQ